MNSRPASYLSWILLSSMMGLPFRTQAAIVIQTPHTAVLETFTTQPVATEWSTTTVGANFCAASADIFDDFSADSLVGTPDNPFGSVDTNFVSDVLTPGVTPGTVAIQNQSRWYSDGFVSTSPTGVAGGLLMARLLNETGATLFELLISYDLGLQNGSVDTPEDAYPGHRVYWSLTGDFGSWNPIGDFGYRGVVGMPANQTEAQSFRAPIAPWPTGTPAYILWLDDNSVNNPDALFTIDNVSFTGIPEPASGLLVWSAAGMLGWMRHRQAH